MPKLTFFLVDAGKSQNDKEDRTGRRAAEQDRASEHIAQDVAWARALPSSDPRYIAGGVSVEEEDAGAV